jgi:predicted Ser/Thr protein kinase
MKTERADAALAELTQGSIVAGRYRIEHMLGRGGMGVVLAARHIALGQRVAIKLMLPDAITDSAAVERFMREALAASRVNSEYVTRVFDMGELPNGAPYIVMEYLEGLDLGQLARQGRLQLSEVATFALQTCEALAEAHAVGIVHRDLKPSNVFCVRRTDGLFSIKVLDFGISKFLVEHPLRGDMSLTSTRSVIGSPYYMSPEQMSSPKTVDARTDIWSLGVMLHELLSGALPFLAESLPELAVRVATEPPVALSSVRPDLPRGLSAVVSRCLEKPRERRYADVGELARALVAFAPAEARVHAERAQRVLQHAAGGGNVAPAMPVSSAPRARQRTRLWWPVGLLLLAGTAGLVWLARAGWHVAAPAPHVVTPSPPRAAESVADVPLAETGARVMVAPRNMPPAPQPTAADAPLVRPADPQPNLGALPEPASGPKARSDRATATSSPTKPAASGTPSANARPSAAVTRTAPQKPSIAAQPKTPPPRAEPVTDELGGRL